MAFNFKTFLLDMAELAPAIVGAIGNLKSEVSGVSKTQLAQDSLHVLTGVGVALLSSNPEEAQMAQYASSIVSASISAFSPQPTPPPPMPINTAPTTGAAVPGN